MFCEKKWYVRRTRVSVWCRGMEEKGAAYFGLPESFLFSLSPRFRVCRTTGRNANICFLNQKHTFIDRGLGFGGTESDPRLFISDDLHSVRNKVADETFTYGGVMYMGEQVPQLSDASTHTEDLYEKKGEIEYLEIWGLGTQSDQEAQRIAQGRDEDNRTERRKVDLAKFVGSGGEDLIKKPKAGGRQGEVDVILEERKRELEDQKLRRQSQSGSHS